MRNTIVRSLTLTFAHSLVYLNGKIVEQEISVPSTVKTVEQAEKYIRKNITDGKLVSVEKIDTIDKLYGMSEADFLRLATPVQERSKDTRNTISKTVRAFSGTLLYMTSAREVKEIPVTIPDDSSKTIDRAVRTMTPDFCKGICIENLNPVDSLYVMKEQDFFRQAKPMTDYNHFA